MRALAGDLLRGGWAVWNIEYRRLGNGGGWPETFADVAAAIDLLAGVECTSRSRPCEPGRPLGRRAPRAVGRWARGTRPRRPRCPIRTASACALSCVIAQAGVCDLAGGYAMWHGGAVRRSDGRLARRAARSLRRGRPARKRPPPLARAARPRGARRGRLRRAQPQLLCARPWLPARAWSSRKIEGSAGRHRAHVDPRGEAWAVAKSWLEAFRRERPSAAHGVLRREAGG